MGSLSIWHWVVVLIVIVLLFGAGRLKRLGSELAQGIQAFKTGIEDKPKEKAATAPKRRRKTKSKKK